MKYYGFKSVAKFPRSNLKNLGFAANGMADVIKSLFANQEQGFAFDFNDLSTMYQNAAGTIPVTGVGQPVGLVLDKSKGLVLGSELASTSSVTSTPMSTQTLTTYLIATVPVNKAYRITFKVTNMLGSGDVGIAGPTTKWLDANTIATTKEEVVICTRTIISTDGKIYLYTRNGVQCVFTDISVKELPGNHATQSTSAKRPILQQNAATGAYYLAFDGVDDFLVTGATTAMGLGTTVFGANKCTKSDFAALVSKSYSGYIYNVSSQVVIQNSAGATALNTTYPEVFTAIYNPNGIDTTIRANGLSKSTANSARGFNNANPLIIGAFDTNNVYAYKGDMYAVIGINRMATINEIANTEQALSKLVGVAL